MEIVNENFKLIRDVWKMERVDISIMFNVNRNIWTNYELGTTEPPPKVLLEMERLTRISFRRLMTVELTRSMIPKEPILMVDADIGSDEVSEPEVEYKTTQLSVVQRLARLESAVFGF